MANANQNNLIKEDQADDFVMESNHKFVAGVKMEMNNVNMPQSLDSAQKEIERIRQTNMILETKNKELISAEDSVRAANRKLTESNETLTIQLKKMSDREIEARTRAEVNEDMVEKLFDKMIARLH